jgi:hypothetical protein
MESGSQPGADPDERILYLRSVFLGWMMFGLIAGVAMIALAYVGHLLAANTGRTVGIAVGAGVGSFCISGCLYVNWHLAYAVWARSKARKWGIESAEYAGGARWSSPMELPRYRATAQRAIAFCASVVPSCARDLMPSLRYIRDRFASTVFGLMKAAAAISRLVSPAVASSATRLSVAVRSPARCVPIRASSTWARRIQSLASIS